MAAQAKRKKEARTSLVRIVSLSPGRTDAAFHYFCVRLAVVTR